jgi:hypothetical protein
MYRITKRTLFDMCQCLPCTLKFITEKEIVAEIVHRKLLCCRTTKTESTGDTENHPHYEKRTR